MNTCTQKESVKISASHPGHATGLYNHPHSLNQLSLMLGLLYMEMPLLASPLIEQGQKPFGASAGQRVRQRAARAFAMREFFEGGLEIRDGKVRPGFAHEDELGEGALP